MERSVAYCSAVDHNVPVVLKAGARIRGPRARTDPSDLLCLDYRVRCTGWCCPLMSVDDRAEANATTTRVARRWVRPT